MVAEHNTWWRAERCCRSDTELSGGIDSPAVECVGGRDTTAMGRACSDVQPVEIGEHRGRTRNAGCVGWENRNTKALV